MFVFRFRLEAALDLRRRKQETLQTELAALQSREAAERATLVRMIDDRNQAIETAASQKTGRIDPADRQVRERHIAVQEAAIAAQRDVVTLVRCESDKKLKEVVTASQDTRALEKLREQQSEQHTQAEHREEQAFLDDLASIRASRSAA